LAALLLSNAILIIHFVLFTHYGYFSAYRIDFLFLLIPFKFLFGPLFLFYVKSLTQEKFRINKRHLIHFLPFLAHYVFLLFTFYIHGHDAKVAIVETQAPLFFWGNKIIWMLFQVQVMSYLFATLRVIRVFRQKLVDFHSNIGQLKLSWLRIILWTFILQWLIDMINESLMTFFALRGHVGLLSFVSIFINAVAALILVYFALQYPTIFAGRDDDNGKIKYEKSALCQEMKKKYLKALLTYIENQKPYLEPNLTLGEIARTLKIQQNYLSQIINELCGKNFHDFINSYRVADAKLLLADEKCIKKSVLEVLYEVGFNSKSSFYTAFSKETGMTPLAFKKKQNNIH
jgi:AraC-like DNA-binding protein